MFIRLIGLSNLWTTGTSGFVCSTRPSLMIKSWSVTVQIKSTSSAVLRKCFERFYNLHFHYDDNKHSECDWLNELLHEKYLRSTITDFIICLFIMVISTLTSRRCLQDVACAERCETKQSNPVKNWAERNGQIHYPGVEELNMKYKV